MRASVCVGILNWNGSALTQKCVQHVLTQSYPTYEILVIDNGSSTEDRRNLRQGLNSPFKLIQLERNIGFAGGMNVAVSEAMRLGHDYIWMLNNDAFPDNDALEKLVCAMESQKDLGAVTPSLFGEDGVEQWAGVRINWKNVDHENLKAGEMAVPDSNGCLVIGTAPLVRTSALRRTGLFDPRFFAYQEEIDLFLRMQKQGFAFRSVPEARCTHLSSASSGGSKSPLRRYLNTRNGFLLIRKHRRRKDYTLSVLKHCAASLERAGALKAYGNPLCARAIVSGLLAAFARERGQPRLLNSFSPLSNFLASHPWRFISILRLLIKTLERFPVAG